MPKPKRVSRAELELIHRGAMRWYRHYQLYEFGTTCWTTEDRKLAQICARAARGKR